MPKKLTIREILTRSTGKEKMTACNAQLKSYRPQEDLWLFKVTCGEEDSKNKGHDVTIRLDTMSNVPLADHSFKARCTCKAWVFGGSDYHAKNNDYFLESARGLKGNGKPPTKKDPRRKNLVCKHVYLCLLKLAKGTHV